MRTSPRVPLRRRGLRITAAVVVALVAAGLLGIVLARSWTQTEAGRKTVTTERHGLVFLPPTARLLAALSVARAAAAGGGTVDVAAIRTVESDVQHAAATDGAALGVGRRWSDLRQRLDALLAQPGGGSAAQSWSDVADLAADLFGAAGDASKLAIDPDPDVHIVADAALAWLPDAIVYAGRAAAIVAQAGGAAPDGQRAVDLAVARYQVALAASRDSSDLGNGPGTGAAETLGTDLTAAEDAFQAAVDSFAPATVLAQLGGPVDPSSLAAGAVQTSALALMITEIDKLATDVAARGTALDNDQRLVIVAAAGALVAILVLVWLLAPVRGRHLPEHGAGDVPGDSGAGVREAQPDAAGLIDARELLLGELVHIGRGVRARVRETGDDAR